MKYRETVESPTEAVLRGVADYLGLQPKLVTYSGEQGQIRVDSSLTQEQQTYLTQVTTFPVRAATMSTTLEWVGSINR